VQRRRKAPIQPQFLVTEAPAHGQCREVEERETHRLLELVGQRASEQDPGDVGLDQAN
jgi:hypothetical protein